MPRGVYPHKAKPCTEHSGWKGGRITRFDGYVMVRSLGHPRTIKSDKGHYVFEHILMAEAALGKSLPITAVVHHRNEIKDDNRNCNLVICENRAYHALIHARMRILAAGGDPDRDRLCHCCHLVKPKAEFHKAGSHNRDGLMNACRRCESERRKKKTLKWASLS